MWKIESKEIGMPMSHKCFYDTSQQCKYNAHPAESNLYKG
jgi:hypothetical protein